MGRSVSFLRADRSLVVVKRILRVAGIEQHIADVDQGRSATLILGERRTERFKGFRPPLQGHERHPALVVRSGSGAAVGCRCRRRLERRQGRLVSPSLARREAQSERVARGTWAPPRGEEASDVEHRSPNVLHIDVVTLFPEVFAPAIGLSILGRAQERGLVRITLHHLLEALAEGERADDRPFGGGPGMVLRLEPIARVLDAVLAAAPAGERRAVVVTSAAGTPFRQGDAERFAALDRLVLICGHYEGIDERLVALYGAHEYSLGDFVLTGGEIPALAFIDATVRLVAGTINAASLVSESFGPSGLDAPAYTRPATFRGADVPQVLLSGDHAKIAAWRREQSRARTIARRNDLLSDE